MIELSTVVILRDVSRKFSLIFFLCVCVCLGRIFVMVHRISNFVHTFSMDLSMDLHRFGVVLQKLKHLQSETIANSVDFLFCHSLNYDIFIFFLYSQHDAK